MTATPSEQEQTNEAVTNADSAGVVSSGNYKQKSMLSSREREYKKALYKRLLKTIDLSLIDSLEEREARIQIRDICDRLIREEGLPLNLESRKRLVHEIENEILGLGPLELLLGDPDISDILVNGEDKIYVERHGLLELTDVQFDDRAHLLNIIDRIVSRVGRRIDESSPMVDARLADGSRVNVIIPPLAIDGPVISIRRFGVEMLSMENLQTMGSLTLPMVKLLEAIVHGKLNVLISGGTGTGKTTLLNVLSASIPPGERVVTIEDSAELQLQQPHVVRLETRPANIESKGSVTQRDLVKNSLRMRPDRIIVGEVRGSEALDMLQAMNTGHDGSLTTIHANSPRDALGRVENMVLMTGIEFPQRSLRSQVASALDVVIQLERNEDGHRRIVSIQEINGMEGEVVTMSEIYHYERRGVDKDGNILGNYQPTGIVPGFYKKLQLMGIGLPIDIFSLD